MNWLHEILFTDGTSETVRSDVYSFDADNTFNTRKQDGDDIECVTFPLHGVRSIRTVRLQ